GRSSRARRRARRGRRWARPISPTSRPSASRARVAIAQEGARTATPAAGEQVVPATTTKPRVVVQEPPTPHRSPLPGAGEREPSSPATWSVSLHDDVVVERVGRVARVVV